MADIDAFASSLLDQAKALYEKGTLQSPFEPAFIHAALMLAFCSLEAHVNAISDDYKVARQDISLVDQAILSEREIKLDHGKFMLGSLKIYRLDDRILHLHATFGTQKVDRSASWWSELLEAISLRNKLTHPKSVPDIRPEQVKRSILSIVTALDKTYLSLYQRNFPPASRGIQSKIAL